MTTLKFQCRHSASASFQLDVEFECSSPAAALFGPSGGGKTTILETIAGLRAVDCAHVELNGRVLTDTTQGVFIPLHRRRTGMVFQDHRLFPHLSVEQNLRYGLRRLSGDVKPLDFDRVVSVLDLRPLLRRNPRRISGGERQRTALGRALLSNPELLLLDEPLSALDETLKDRILSYIERVIGEWSIPMLLVSHSQAEIRRLAQWVYVIEEGRLLGEGAPEDALTQPGALGWKDALAPVNVLRIDRIEPAGDLFAGVVGGQRLLLPPEAAMRPAPVYVRFSPSSILLSRHDVQDVSARNHLRGVVRKIIELPEACFLSIDAGQIIWAEVTHQACRDLGVEPGVELVCLIKTHSLKLID